MKKIYLKKDYFQDPYTLVEDASKATHIAFANDDFESLKRLLKGYEKEVEALSKGVRKESNQEQDIMPKKFHTGYILMKSNPIDITVKDNGNLVKKEVYESILQTPYKLTFDRNQVIMLVSNDIVNLKLMNKLGFKGFMPYMKHNDMFDARNRKKIYKDKISEFETVEDLIQQNVIDYETFEKIINEIAYNVRLRINGKTRCWELQFNHIDPIVEIPWDLTKLTKKEKEKKNGDANSEAIHEASEDAE